MKIVVFGANGGVGRRLVELALAENHLVTAAVRNPAKLTMTHERLRIVTCDVLDAAAVAQAVAGQDAVLCALGTDNRPPVTLYSTGARNIVQQMQAHHVRRIVFLSNFGVLGETAQGARQAMLLFLVNHFIRHTLADHRRALDEIRGRSVEWTIVRPLPLTNGPQTGIYRVAVDDLPARGTRISRADVADFMLRQVTGNDYLNKLPSIAY